MITIKKHVKKQIICAYILSKWHLYGLESYLIENSLIDGESDIIIFVGYHTTSDRFRITIQDFKYLSLENASVYFVKEFKEKDILIRSKLRNNIYKNMILVTVKDTSFKDIIRCRYIYKIKSIDNILIDEGIGTYSDERMWNMSLREEGVATSQSSNIKVLVKKHVLSNFKFLNITNRFLFFNRKGTLYLNESVAKAYRNYFRVNKDKKYILDELNNKVILIVSDNITSIFKEKHFEQIIYDQILKKVHILYPGHNIYIKPHPNELKDIGKFSNIQQDRLLVTADSFEDILNNNSIDLVMGFTSTSLLTAAVLFNTKVNSLNELIDKKLLNDFGRMRIENFNKLVSEISNINFIK